jgi:hypothetical protein
MDDIVTTIGDSKFLMSFVTTVSHYFCTFIFLHAVFILNFSYLNAVSTRPLMSTISTNSITNFK